MASFIGARHSGLDIRDNFGDNPTCSS